MGDEDYDGALPGAETELAPSADVTSAHTAWSLDDGEDVPASRFSSGQITAIAVCAAVILAAGAGVVAWQHTRGTDLVSDQTTAAPPTTTTKKGWGGPAINRPPPKPLPPSTVTVTAPPPPPVTQQVAVPQAPPTAPSVIPDLVLYNEQFLGLIQQRGWAVWDRQLMLNRAHATCSMLRDGESPDLIASKLMGVERQLSWQMAVQFVGTVRDAYPNCG